MALLSAVLLLFSRACCRRAVLVLLLHCMIEVAVLHSSASEMSPLPCASFQQELYVSLVEAHHIHANTTPLYNRQILLSIAAIYCPTYRPPHSHTPRTAPYTTLHTDPVQAHWGGSMQPLYRPYTDQPQHPLSSHVALM